MNDRNIYKILPVASSLSLSDITKTINYLSSYNEIFLPNDAKDILFKERSIASSPMNKVFYAFVDESVYNNFSLIYLNSGSGLHVPECITYRHVTTDINQIFDIDPSVQRRILISDNLKNKLISNITQMVKTDGRYYHLKDQDRFQSQIVRDSLVRSYYTAKDRHSWLRNSVILTSAKTYALLLGNNISRWFGLDKSCQDYITVVFGAFFLNKTVDSRDVEGYLYTNCRSFYIPDRDSMRMILDKFESLIGKRVPDTLEECFILTNNLGVERLVLGRRDLYSKLKTIGDEYPVSTIALEYPPYFIWCILNAVSGSKNQLNLFIKKQNLMRDIQVAIGELIQSVPPLV